MAAALETRCPEPPAGGEANPSLRQRMKGMRVKPRLAAVAGLVPEGGVVADIGTDHAYLPIYLVQEGLAHRVVAVENRLSTLAGARRSLNLFNQAHKIELRLGDGLEALRRTDRVDTVVLAGLGGRTICRLLARSRERWTWFQGLVLQPMQETPLVRRWLAAHRWRLVRERLVREGERFYEVMVVQQGRQVPADPLMYEIGPCLFQERDPLLAPFLRQKIERCHIIIKALNGSPRRESHARRIYLEEKEARLKEVLALVGDGATDC